METRDSISFKLIISPSTSPNFPHLSLSHSDVGDRSRSDRLLRRRFRPTTHLPRSPLIPANRMTNHRPWWRHSSATETERRQNHRAARTAAVLGVSSRRLVLVFV
ncbi:hypothetical protein HanXRQr2_Chr17g0787581 [Helianthus annuus]|uniref:Uncharacterized protein n=1 Tax=Helianthus annuus TaxID=4232 RepID=A0A9K3DG70_HELAN|nr:hypothetical protein HanXRQr2_Chr17g0787581 [Helianthus annuus]